MKKIEIIFGSYFVRDFTNVDLDVSGVQVYNSQEENIGSMIGLSIPDEDDEAEFAKFVDELETWIVDNE